MKNPNLEPLKILSASSTRTRGYIYIEARIQQHVVRIIFDVFLLNFTIIYLLVNLVLDDTDIY